MPLPFASGVLDRRDRRDNTAKVIDATGAATQWIACCRWRSLMGIPHAIQTPNVQLATTLFILPTRGGYRAQNRWSA